MPQNFAEWATTIGFLLLVLQLFWAPKALIDFRKKHQELFWLVATILFLCVLYNQTHFIDFITYKWSLPIWVFGVIAWLLIRVIIDSIKHSDSNDSSDSSKIYFDYLGGRWEGNIWNGFWTNPTCLTDHIEMISAYSYGGGGDYGYSATIEVFRCPDCKKEINKHTPDGRGIFEEVRIRYNQSVSKSKIKQS